MDVRETMAKIIQNSVGGCTRHRAEIIADDLIARGETVQQWIPVYKKLPKKGQPVLIRGRVGADSIGEYRGNGIWFDLVFRADNVTHGHGGYEYGITHWADPTQLLENDYG